MILVTGSTGVIGASVVRELVGHGASVRALTRDPVRAEAVLGSRVDFAVGSYDDEESLGAAMKGVDRVFVLSPIHPDLARWEANVLAAARAGHVSHVVKLSTAGIEWVGQGPPVPTLWALHRTSEEQIEKSGVPFTHLRPDACMQNVLMFAEPIAAGVYPAPTGAAQRAWVDVRDVAAAAAVVLTEPGHEGRSYELTGPEALSDDDVAAKITVVTGREVKHMDPPVEVARANMVERGMSAGVADMISEVMVAIAAGRSGKVANGIVEVTGQPPRSFDTFVKEFESNFIGN